MSFKQALRRVARQRAATSVIVLTIGTAVAVSAVVYCIADAVLLRPFPFRDQQSVASIWAADTSRDMPKFELTFDEVDAISKQSRTLSDIAAYQAANFSLVLTSRGTPMQMSGGTVSRSFFSLLGVTPQLGRTFSADEHKPGSAFVAVVSDKFWREQLAGDKDIVGRTFGAGGSTVEVVGVLPRGFEFPRGTDVLFPMEPGLDGDGARQNRVFAAIGRLKPDATFASLSRELRVIASRVTSAYPPTERSVTYTAKPLVDEILGGTRRAVEVLFVMSVLILVIATFNVTGILLTQAIARQREFAVRSALGATGLTFFRQMLLEGAVLVGLSAIPAAVLVRILLAVVTKLAPADIPRIGEVDIRFGVIAFAAIVCAVIILVIAANSMMQLRRQEMVESLRDGARATGGRTVRSILSSFAGAQIALTLAMLVAAVVVVGTFRAYATIDVGFQRQRVVTGHLPMGYTLKPDRDKKVEYFRQLHRSIREIPGVEASGSALMRPLEMEQGWDFAFTIAGQGTAQQQRNPLASLLSCTPGYFDAMGLPLLRGRRFAESDEANAQKVVIVGESFARRYWGVDRAIGQRLKSGPPDSPAPWATVVGVVKDHRSRGLTAEKLDIWIPYTQTNWSPNYLAVRTTGDPATVINSIRKVASTLDKDTPLMSVMTTSDLVDAKLAHPRLNAFAVALFALTALFLAIVGTYGVLNYTVAQRTKEFGVRMALGAGRSDLFRIVWRDVAIIAGGGIAIGLLLSVAATRLVHALSYGVDPADVRWLLLGIGCLIAAIAAAAALPAVRAAALEPLECLRQE